MKEGACPPTQHDGLDIVPTCLSYLSSTSANLVFMTALTESLVLMCWNVTTVSNATSADRTVLNTSSMNLRMSNSMIDTWQQQ